MPNYLDNFNKWLNSEYVDQATKDELLSIKDDENEIKGRFGKLIDFGTAGLRGKMMAGTNCMNVYVIRYFTQGVANLILECGEDYSGGVTITFDSRNNSLLYSREAASVLAANGIKVHIFEELHPTPEVSFALRELNSIAAINITASHNTKEYNGYKVYWSDGAQLPPEHAARISSRLKDMDFFTSVKYLDFNAGLENGMIDLLGDEMDEKYLAKVLEQSTNQKYVDMVADDFAIIYTPFHGTGYKLVPEILKRIGMKKVITVPEQMVLDGNFPTVKSPNPEYVEGFALAIELAKKNNVDLIIGTDPDGDRAGICVLNGDKYETLTGNQIGVLLLDFLIKAKREEGTLAANSAAVKSIVSSVMANKICADNNIKLFETLTGFKYIGEKIKEFEATGEYTYLFGFEESNGYLAGTYARDKDAVVASMLIAEMACWYKAQGKNLYEAMQEKFAEYGFFSEKVLSYTVEGFDGTEKMQARMEELRSNPLTEIAGLKVKGIRDFKKNAVLNLETKEVTETGLPISDIVYYDLEDECKVIIRPSGTEPKIKAYVMVNDKTKEASDARLEKAVAAAWEMITIK